VSGVARAGGLLVAFALGLGACRSEPAPSFENFPLTVGPQAATPASPSNALPGDLGRSSQLRFPPAAGLPPLPPYTPQPMPAPLPPAGPVTNYGTGGMQAPPGAPPNPPYPPRGLLN